MTAQERCEVQRMEADLHARLTAAQARVAELEGLLREWLHLTDPRRANLDYGGISGEEFSRLQGETLSALRGEEVQGE